jgi:hypothetical protein
VKQIGYQDQKAASEVIDFAYDLLSESETLPKDKLSAISYVGERAMCINASDAVTRAAHSLGILASREGHGVARSGAVESHDNIEHYITSFGTIEDAPKETDPIICLTWGQFDQFKFRDYRRAYFGPRVGILQLVGINDYRNFYSSNSTIFKQITYTPSDTKSIRNLWLRTKPGDFKEQAYPLGEVSPNTFPAHMWDYPNLLPQPE